MITDNPEPREVLSPYWTDEKRLKMAARELSRQFRQRIVADATRANVPSIKYKHQYLLEEVIADMEAFV